MKRLLIAAVLAAIFIFGLWNVALTDEMLTNLIGNSLKNGDMRLDADNLKKGLFFNFKSSRVTLNKSGKALMSMDNVTGRINPLAIIMGRPALHLRGDLGGGRIDGEVGLLKGNSAHIRVNGANLDGIPFLGSAGLEGRGTLSGECRLEKSTGDIKFALQDAHLKAGSFGGVSIPLDMFHRAKGAMTLSGTALKIVSFSLEGDGIYARIKGNITGNRLNLTLELMPDRTFKEENLIFSALGNFKVSPGYYVIPITKTLAF